MCTLKTREISLEPVFVIYVFGIYIDKFTQILNGRPLSFSLQIMLTIYQDMRIIIRKRFIRDQDLHVEKLLQITFDNGLSTSVSRLFFETLYLRQDKYFGGNTYKYS